MESTPNVHVLDPTLTKDENLRALALSIPVEEMLGSVTTYNTPDDSSGKLCQQLRTSARVIKKLKLDSTDRPKEVIATPPVEELKPIEPVKPKIRTKVLCVWSPEDKTHFFEAIKDYGKDFDAIHEYMGLKCKKKGIGDQPPPAPKTREQVRHFYYRTLHKISKYLKFSEEVKKVVQEYYALINYGELRRKIGATSEKTCMKLNELMYRGATQVRVRGKTIRIKTPSCRTLRRLNQIDERPEDLKLPAKVMIELRPRDMNTWMQVQEMGQNPRIRCSLPLQKRLNVLIACLNSRWRTPEQYAYENALLNNNEMNGTPSAQTSEDDKKNIPKLPILHVAPKPGVPIQLPNINYNEFLVNSRISLSAYEERMGIKQRGEEIWLASINPPKKRRTHSYTAESRKMQPDTTDPGGGSDGQHHNETVLDQNLLSPPPEMTDPKEAEQKLENIRNGWSIQDSITIGELYLMIGSESKIVLEYWWENPVKKEHQNENTDEISIALQKLLSLARLYYRKEKVECPCGHVCGVRNRASVIRNKTTPTNSKIQKLEARLTNIADGAKTVEEVTPTPPKPNNNHDGVFRLPSVPNSYFPHHSVLEAFRAKLDALKPRFCQRRGRMIRPAKQVVVQRTLPLLPNNGTESLSMKVIPQGSLSTEFKENKKTTHHSIALSPISIEPDDEPEPEPEPKQERESILPPSPTPTIGTLLDIVDTIPITCSKEPDAMDTSSSFTDFLTETTRGIQTPLSTSPSRLLKEDDAHWLNSEVADFSFSSFLGHLDASPIKTDTSRVSTAVHTDDTRMSQDMEAQLQSLMGESSIDYMAKFADLAAQMSAEGVKK